jgi:hypothetical protein
MESSPITDPATNRVQATLGIKAGVSQQQGMPSQAKTGPKKQGRSDRHDASLSYRHVSQFSRYVDESSNNSNGLRAVNNPATTSITSIDASVISGIARICPLCGPQSKT